jgi:transcription termination factor NusB
MNKVNPRGYLGRQDWLWWALTNKPQDQAAKGVTETLADLTNRLESLLSESQFRRLAEIQTRQQGTTALLRAGLMSLMDYKPEQKEKLEQVISETLAATKELEQRAANGEHREPL